MLLCDRLPDGTVAGRVVVEAVYDTVSGDRVGTRTVDAATGTPYVPQGTLGPCPVSSDCAEQTTPTATEGLCLADGTPIAVTIVRDCTGAVTSEGWVNLTTGAYSAGAPPAGTVACGDSRSIAVSGTFCDVDAGGEVVGLVLIEYQYATDGTIESVRLVDAVTGSTYTPAGTVTTCPAGEVDPPEQDVVELCDTAASGTRTPFLRDFRRDEFGAIVGHSDYTVAGAPYTPAGTVSLGPCAAPATVTARHMNVVPGTSWTPAQVQAGRRITALTYTVLAGTAAVTDAAGTAVNAIPAGASVTWTNEEEGTLAPPTSIAAETGGRVLVHWTEA
ncbi:hypothetical protein ACIQMV_38320 [Streptomyces sp. NPDC091412]|uniref:hypothetical protein n=1 Tax=Streptomyces sp. NPDC091412 TaxID=3366002 RepID=UPI00382D07EC